jgi:hypothetical protein
MSVIPSHFSAKSPKVIGHLSTFSIMVIRALKQGVFQRYAVEEGTRESERRVEIV